jgi:hypothetical protein
MKFPGGHGFAGIATTKKRDWTVVAMQNIWLTRHKVFILTNGYQFVVLWDNVMPHIAKGELTVDDIVFKRIMRYDEPCVLLGRKKVYVTSIV